MLGTHLGRWVIDRPLGKGAMGAVYFAHAEDAPDEVRALKVLAPDLARDPVARQRFQRETDLLCHLDHPNIVRFDGAGVEGDTLYYVMEFVNGPDCESRLRELGRWPWWEVIDLTIQIVRGLKFAHDQGVVHRDLKPANILLSHGDKDEAPPTTVAKIADFGVARVFSQGQLTGSGQFIGTALYMAPEQAAGKPATKRSDFYALGCVMYTLLTGRPPFNGTSLAELVHKHQFIQPERAARLVTDLPHDLDELVMQLLSKEPAQRPADGSVLLRRLESLRGKLARKHNLAATAFRTEAPKAPVWTSDEAVARHRPATDWPKVMRATLLSLALVAVVSLIAWKLTRPRTTAQELFDKARPLMQSTNPDDWNRAWTEYLEPMISRYPKHPYEQEIETFRRKREPGAALHRFVTTNRRAGPRSEPQRFFELGLQRCQAGDVEGGRRVWKDLIEAFGNVEAAQPWVQLAQRGLSDVQPTGPVVPELPDIKAALEQARKLADGGQRDKAEAIWRGLEDLYRDAAGGESVRTAIRAERSRKP